MKKQRNYDKRVRNTRILLSDYLLLKELSQVAGVSMAETLHELITRQVHKTPVPVTQIPVPAAQIPMPVTVAEVTPALVAQVPINPIVKLRATIAGRGSTNGRAKQM